MLDTSPNSCQESCVCVILFYASSSSGPGAGIGCTPRRIKHCLASFLRLVAALSLVLSAASWGSLADETNSPPPATRSMEDTNSQALLHACLQLQGQLRATELAIEQNGQEIKEGAARNAEALSKALVSIQESFASQRARDLEATQSSNQFILLVVSTFAAVGFLTLLMLSYLQWRMSNGLARISAAIPAALGSGPQSATGALGPGGQSQLPAPGAMQHHEQRVPEPLPSAFRASKPNEAPIRVADLRLFPGPATSLRIRPIRPLRTAVIIGLIFAAALALVLYALTYSKLGICYLHDVFKS